MLSSFVSSLAVVLAIPCLLFAHNVDSVSLSQLPYPLAVLTGMHLVLFALLRILLRDHRRAAVAAGVFWLLFFSYGGVCDILWRHRSLEDLPRLERSIGVVFCMLYGLTLLALRRRISVPPVLVNWMALSSICSVMLGLVTSLPIRMVSSSAGAPPSTAASEELDTANTHPALLPRPDIYHIILDGYAGSSTLRREYGMDNSDFLEALRSRGFAVLDKTSSNYATTFLSLAATLNYQYWDFSDNKSRSRLWFYRQIQNSSAAREFRKLGYRVLWIGSNWTGTEHSNMADRVFRYSRFPFKGEFNSLLWRLTPLRHLEPSVAGSHLFAFNTLESIALDSAATYTFAHLLLPHNPYVFDEQGNIIRNVRQALQFDRTIFGRDERWGDKKGYLAQLRCANQKTLNMIDTILKRSDTRPIIVLQSDHGSASLVGKSDNIIDLSRERHDVLNAVLGPDELVSDWPRPVTLINTYPTLLRVVSGKPFQSLTNRLFYSGYSDPYDIQEVTGDLLIAPPENDERHPEP